MEANEAAIGSNTNEPLGATDLPRARIDLVEGDQPCFTDETACLLRQRLVAANLVLTGLLSLGFGISLVIGTTLYLGARGAILAACLGMALLLRSRIHLNILLLRLLEVGLFGIVGFQMILMAIGRIE